MRMLRVCGAVTLGLSMACAPTSGQVPRYESFDVDAVIDGLLADTVKAAGPEGGLIVRAFLYPDNFPAGSTEALADRLATILAGGVGTETFQFKVARFLILAGSPERGEPVERFVETVGRALAGSQSNSAQEALIEGLRTAFNQGAATTVLGNAARMEGDVALMAVRALSVMGEAGRQKLLELAASDAVRNPAARAAIQHAVGKS